MWEEYLELSLSENLRPSMKDEDDIDEELKKRVLMTEDDSYIKYNLTYP